MANDTGGPGNGLLYALIGALCVVVAGGGVLHLPEQPGAALGGASAAARAPAAGSAGPAPAPVLRRSRPRRQVRRQASSPRRAQRSPMPGGWRRAAISPAPKRRCRVPTASSPALPKPRPRGARSPTCATTRGDGRRDRADRRQDATRIATLVEAARAAIARRDYGAADRALDEAEQIDARDPAVVRARNELQEAAARPGRRDERN